MRIAQEHFLQHGYSATSMSHIAESLGGSKATLWTYFSSKEDLFRYVINAASMEFQRELTVGLAQTDSLEETLLQFCRRLIERIVSPSALALRRVVAAEAVRFPDVAETFYHNVPARLHHVLGALLDPHMRSGKLRTTDPLEAAEVLTSICHARCFWRAAFGLNEDVKAHEIQADAKLAVDVFLRAYSAPGE
jgi:AcrR family transcriptional regulator